MAASPQTVVPPFEEVLKACEEVFPAVVDWRRHLHANPELSNEEMETAKYIRTALESFKCPSLTITNPIPNAVLADLKGSKEGPIIALRADIDALPLQEDMSVESFASTKENIMHACGHDGHTAMLLGAAKVLCQHYTQLKGTVRFVFQHAEERHPGGAVVLCELGAMKGVQSIIGLHVVPQLPVGCLALKEGYLSSMSDSFTMHVVGKGGHASTPHLGKDPVPVAAEVVLALQTIVSRKIDPKLAPVLSIPTITTGPNESHNVIPDEVKLMGTLRSQDYGIRDFVRQEMENVLKGITSAHGLSYRFEFKQGYDMVNNDPAVTTDVRAVVTRLVKSPACIIVPKDPAFGGEDFSSYQKHVPGCFVAIGVGNKEAGIEHNLHTCKFRMDEKGLLLGVQTHVGYVYSKLISDQLS